MNLDVPLSEDDKARLALALGRNANIERVAKIVALAGATEALDQATGRSVPSTIAEVRSHRIYCLVRQGMTLAEAEALVAYLFKVPAPAAKRMVMSAVARYSVELNADVNKAAAATLDDAEWNEDAERWEVAMPTAFIRDRFLDILSRGEQPDPSPARRGSIWQFPDETFAWLREQLGLEKKDVP